MSIEFETTGRICAKHKQPASIICLNKDCQNVACCPECVRADHPHPRMLISFLDFAKLIPKIVTQKIKNIPVSDTPRYLKPQFEQEQSSALGILKKKLVQDKNKLYEELDRIEESTQKCYPKPEIMRHLANFDYFRNLLAPKLIELKVCCSNQQSITPLRDRMIQLHLIGDREYEAAKEYRKIKEAAWKKMRAVMTQCIIQRINKALNYQKVPELKKREKSLEPERVQPLATSKITNKSEQRSQSPRKKIISCRKL